MSFLTAASDRSSRGSGVSGASVASFSGASSFSFSLAAALVLVAMHLSSRRPLLGTPLTQPNIPPYALPLPYAGRVEPPPGHALAVLRPRRQPSTGLIRTRECRRPRLNPD